MRRPPHLLRVDRPVAELAALFAALRQDGQRAGWLELAGSGTVPRPAALEAAAGLGALRAVAVDDERTVVVKPRRGAPVLGDLLREHFRGAAVVLVQGADLALAPLLRPAGDGWELVEGDGAETDGTETQGTVRALSTEALLAALRQPSGPGS